MYTSYQQHEDATEEVMSMLTITHTAADGTLLEGTRKGDGAWEAIKAAQAQYKIRGWKYFPSIRAIGVSHSRDKAPKLGLIEATAEALRAAGFEVTVQVDAAPRAMEDAEADRAERMDARAHRLQTRSDRLTAESDAHYARADEIAKRRPFGQPILIGHHSEAGARADQRRIESNMDKFCEKAAEARRAEAAAEAAQKHMQHREAPGVTARRIKTLEAERRKVQKYLDGYTVRHLMGDGKTVAYVDTSPPATGAYREQLEASATHLDEQLRYWREQLEAAKADGHWSPIDASTIQKGDLVKVRSQWRRVVRVNKTTVSVETGYSWTDRVPLEDIREHQSGL